jgi:GDP-4-dehydro-6-deoxy-D-mannose reductase
MNPSKILVTGADGFVGRFLLPVLRADFPGAEIQGTGRLDITDRAAVFAAVAAARPEVCVHLAGIAAIGQALADPARTWAVNLHGALNLAEAILAHAPDCRMIFISSAEVYGGSFRAGVALDERAALAPMNLYAATKAAAELALGAMAGNGLRLLRLRPFNHTGPGQAEAFVVPAFAGQIARIEAGLAPPVIKVGALRPARDFMDVRDVCAAYAACVRPVGELPENAVLNIASGRAVKIGDILRMLLDQARVKIDVAEDPARLRAVEIERAVGDAGLAERLLGWRPRIALEETLAGVLAAARAGVRT